MSSRATTSHNNNNNNSTITKDTVSRNVDETSSVWSTYNSRITKSSEASGSSAGVLDVRRHAIVAPVDGGSTSDTVNNLRHLATNSKVDQYLAARNSLSINSNNRLASDIYDAAHLNDPNQSMPISSDSSSSSSDEDDDDDVSHDEEDVKNKTIDLTDATSYDDDDDDNGDDEPNWSVRVCVVSAVDFPSSVIPNLPFSPILKVGLVPIPTVDEIQKSKEILPINNTLASTNTGTATSNTDTDQKDRSDNNSKNNSEESLKHVLTTIERTGLASIQKSRLRSTSTKILSKRDNGSVEFHEELRWDHVRSPQQTVLAIELYSRSVMTPANIKESPPPPSTTTKTGQLSATNPSLSHQRNNTPSANTAVSRYNSNHSNSTNTNEPPQSGGGLSMLFRRPGTIRKSESVEMEEANAAAAVAKLLVESGGDDIRTSRESSGGSTQQYTNKSILNAGYPNNEMDVKLRIKDRKRNSKGKRKRKKVKMTDDLRLGSAVIPLTSLPLEKVLTNNTETARIERWFELKASHSGDATAVSRTSCQILTVAFV